MIHSNIHRKFILLVVGLCYVCVCFARSVPGSVGDKCNVAFNVTGTCKLIENCPRAVLQKNESKSLLYCGEDKEDNPLVCCPNVGNITEQQCRVYGKEVFVTQAPVILIIGSDAVNESTCVNEGETFVINGVDAKEKEFPHMALLGYGKIGNLSWLCGGALISNQYVLTAAHCSFARSVGTGPQLVRLGELNKAEKEDTNRIDYNVKEFIKHPSYTLESKYHDIALILLDEEVTFSAYIRPACLNTLYPIDKKMIATGWGSLGGGGDDLADVLQKVSLEQFSKNECLKFYNDAKYAKKLPEGITDDLICAGDKTKAKDTCGGDSGGPLQVYHSEVYCMLSITGVTSFGKYHCGEAGVPGVYTRVSSYIEWIENIVWI